MFTREQLAQRVGFSASTIKRMERSGFLTPKQRAYLDAVGYNVGFYPRRASKPTA